MIGYKTTDIGIIPEDWDIISFKDAFTFLSTASYSRNQLSESGNIAYVHYGDIHTKFEHFLDFEKVDLPLIKRDQLRTYSLLKEGDLIMADASEDYEGVCKSVEVINLGNRLAISGLHTFLLRAKDKTLSDRFKGYIDSNTLVRKQFNRLATGLKVYGVSKGNLKLVFIPLPPLPEQKAIAEVLSDTDNLIQSLEKQIAKKRLIKQGAMQKLLSPKVGWKTSKLGEIVNFFNGKAHEPFINEYGNYKVINSKFISSNGDIVKYASVNLCPLKKGNITMVMSDIPNGKALAKCFVVPKNNIYALNQRICGMRTNSMDTYFLSAILNRNQYFLEFDSGTGQTNLRKSEVLECPVTYPPKIYEQQQISSTLIDMENEILALKKKLQKYNYLKQGLMQNLLTGKIRI